MDMSKGKALVEAMKAKVRAKLRKKHGGSIQERLKKAQNNNPTKKLGQGSQKVEQMKAKVREAIRKRNK